MYGPQNEVHYSVQRQKTGTFSLMAPTTGPYRICLSNRMSTLTEKTVAFSIHMGDELFRDVAKQGGCNMLLATCCTPHVSDALTHCTNSGNRHLLA